MVTSTSSSLNKVRVYAPHTQRGRESYVMSWLRIHMSMPNLTMSLPSNTGGGSVHISAFEGVRDERPHMTHVVEGVDFYIWFNSLSSNHQSRNQKHKNSCFSQFQQLTLQLKLQLMF